MDWLITLQSRLILTVILITLCSCTDNKQHHRERDLSSTEATLRDINMDNEYTPWTMDKFPNPQKEPIKCGRSRQSSFLCDPDRILTSREGKLQCYDVW